VITHTAFIGVIAARSQVTDLRPTTAVDPVSALGCAVIAQNTEAWQLLASLKEDCPRFGIFNIDQGTTRNLFGDLFCRWICSA